MVSPCNLLLVLNANSSLLTAYISLDLFEMGKKTGVLTISFTKDQSPPVQPSIPVNDPVAEPKASVNVPRPPSPHFLLLNQSPADSKKVQSVGYQREDLSIDQVNMPSLKFLGKNFSYLFFIIRQKKLCARFWLVLLALKIKMFGMPD